VDKEIALREHTALIKYLSYATAKGNYALGGELVEVGILALLVSVEKFDESKGVKFITYAYKKIRGAMLDYMQKERREPILLNDFDKHTIEKILMNSEQIDVDELIQRRELLLRLRKMVDELPTVHRKVINYYYTGEYDFQDIAMALGLSRVRIHKIHIEAKEMLKKKLLKSGVNGYPKIEKSR
jgi:RNA polymerase sigma factor FliA